MASGALTPESSTQGFVLRALVLYALMLAGGVFYLRYFALGAALPMNYDRAFFWAVNALTCTGFRVTPNGLNDFSTAGVVGVYLLSMAGGAFSMSVGGVLVCRLAGLRHSAARVMAAAGVLLAGGGLLGALPLMGNSRGFGAALFEATGAVANSGMTLDIYRSVSDWRLQAVTLPLAAIGALSIPVLLDLYDRYRHGRPISSYARWVLDVFVLAWLVMFAFLLVMNAQLPWRENVLTSWACAINTRSLGANLGETFGRQIWLALSIFMLIGAPLGGAGGGLRLMPLSVIWRGGAMGEEEDRMRFRAALPGAAAWLFVFITVYLVLFVAMLNAEPQATTDRLMVMSAAALGNTGLSEDVLVLDTRGMIVLAAGMLAGYLLPLRFAAWIVPPVSR